MISTREKSDTAMGAIENYAKEALVNHLSLVLSLVNKGILSQEDVISARKEAMQHVDALWEEWNSMHSGD